MDREDAAATDGASAPASRVARDQLPGGPEARALGCCCSVLANAGYRVDASRDALVDPSCPLHNARPDGTARQ